MTILEILSRSNQYLPGTVSDYVSLQLANRLSDRDSAEWYRSLIERHPLPHLLSLYQRSMAPGPQGAKERFRAFLNH
jgi:hypothetical protein